MDRTLLQRYEIKYVIPESRVPAVRDFFMPYMQPDSFTAQAMGSYAISSLYLDTRDMSMSRETTTGIKQRFKMRIRAYDDDALSTLFCEVKHRDGDIVSKTRVGVPRRAVEAIMNRTYDLDELPKKKDRVSLADFQSRVVRWRAVPAMVVRYDREAYECKGGAPVRITFDRHLRCAKPVGCSVPVDSVPWHDVHWHRDPTSLVLEVKFTGPAPNWIRQMIRNLEVRQRGFGKYVLSVADFAAASRAGTMEGSRS